MVRVGVYGGENLATKPEASGAFEACNGQRLQYTKGNDMTDYTLTTLTPWVPHIGCIAVLSEVRTFLPSCPAQRGGPNNVHQRPGVDRAIEPLNPLEI